MKPRDAQPTGSQSNSPATRLEQAVQRLGITQAEIARRTRTLPAYVNDVIHGRRSLTEAFAAMLQMEFGVDKIWLRHGEGQVFRRLPSGESLHGSVAMTPVPLLDRPCQGNPLDSEFWVGSTHPLPRGMARPAAPDRYRYVLRIAGCGCTRAIHDDDRVLVENLPGPDPHDFVGCWCVVETHEGGVIRQIRPSDPGRAVIWGRCLGIVWRQLPNPG